MKELIERLNALKSRLNVRSAEDLEHRATIMQAVQALESMPVWVKCSERLPETDGDYLLFDGQESGEGSWNEKLGFRWKAGWPAAVQLWCVIPSPAAQITG